MTNNTKGNEMHKVNDLIDDDGFTVSVGDMVLVDGVNLHVVEMWNDGTLFACDDDGESNELNIDDIELAIP